MSTVLAYVLAVWLMALAGLIAVRMLNGAINTRGLFRVDVDGDVSPARLQLFLLTFAAAIAYAADVLSTLNASQTPPRLPEPSDFVLGVVGASNSVYLLSKARKLLGILGGSQP